MPTARGRLRYGPRGSTVPRKGWWAILECDPDWHGFYAPWIHRKIPGQWMMAVDRERVFEGRLVDTTPHLGLVKPLFQMPAWGPHISVIRNEKPTLHLDVWELQVRLGDAEQEVESLRHAIRYWQDKVTAYAEEVSQIGPGCKPKFRQAADDALRDMRATLTRRERHQGRAKKDVKRFKADWKRMRKGQGLPDGLTSGVPVKFQYDEMLIRGRTHWLFKVWSGRLLQFREFFGLPRKPRVPLHLTIGVTEGGVPGA